MAEDDPKSNPQRGPLRGVVGLGLILVLVLGVVFMVRQLQHASAMQDCIASGRTNCAPVSTER